MKKKNVCTECTEVSSPNLNKVLAMLNSIDVIVSKKTEEVVNSNFVNASLNIDDFKYEINVLENYVMNVIGYDISQQIKEKFDKMNNI